MPPSSAGAAAPRPLNARQQRFVVEYLQDRNASAAARRAGYRGRGNTQAVGLMKDARVKAAIAAEQARRAAPMTREQAAEGLRRIAEASVLDYVRPGKDGAPELDLWRLERDRAGPVRELTVVEKTDPVSGVVTRTVGFKLADRSAALMKLLPMLEAREGAEARDQGRRHGIAAVMALTPEQFGRFREGWAAAGRGRKARPADAALADFLAAEATAAPTRAQRQAEEAMARREAEVARDLELLHAQQDDLWRERQAMVAQAQRLVRLREEVEGGRR